MITGFPWTFSSPGQAPSVIQAPVPEEGKECERDRLPDTAAARMKKSARPRTLTGASPVSRLQDRRVLDGTRAAERCPTGFTETFELPVQPRHAPMEFNLARFKPVHAALQPVQARCDFSPPVQDQPGQGVANARFRFGNDFPGCVIPVSSRDSVSRAPDFLASCPCRRWTLP